jgi:hypothetical protein
MNSLSSSLRRVTDADGQLFARHKAQLRQAFIRAHTSYAGDWTESDDLAMDAAITWLEKTAYNAKALPHISQSPSLTRSPIPPAENNDQT